MAEREHATRAARVLDPGFVEGLAALSVEDLRGRRDQALSEREFLSYLRRLVQVRRDLLADELARRRAGLESPPLVDRLTAVLSEGPRGAQPRGEALRTTLSEQDIAEAERRADSLLGSLMTAGLEGLSEEEMESRLQVLDREERGISADRTAVFAVHDVLQDELKRRYREDPAAIPRER